MAPKVHTPVKGYNGKVAGVSFVDGAGETDDPSALAYFERAGYKVAAEPELTEKEKLQAKAKELGLSAEGTVAELKARLAEHKKAAKGAPAGGENPPANGTGSTGGEQEKEAAK